MMNRPNTAPMENEKATTSGGPGAPPPLPPSPSSSNHLPRLMLPCKAGMADRTFYGLSEGRCCNLHLPELVGKRCYATSHGWLLAGEDSSGERFLLNPITKARIELPHREFKDPMQNVAISSSPAEVGCVVSSVLVNRVVFCRPCDPRWSVHRSTGCDRDESGSSTDYVSHNGMFYFLRSSRSLVVIDLVGIGGGPRERQVDMDGRLLPPAQQHRHNFLVGSEGELLLVAADDGLSCKVFRADMAGKAWVAVESLGDKVLFLGRGCSVAMPAAGHGDRIYFSYTPLLSGGERRPAGIKWRWFWAMLVLGVGGRAIKYAPPMTTEGFSWEACHWFVPNS